MELALCSRFALVTPAVVLEAGFPFFVRGWQSILFVMTGRIYFLHHFYPQLLRRS